MGIQVNRCSGGWGIPLGGRQRLGSLDFQAIMVGKGTSRCAEDSVSKRASADRRKKKTLSIEFVLDNHSEL